jgi:hypothetical protein
MHTLPTDTPAAIRGLATSLGSARATGLAVLRAYANLRVVTPGPAHVNLDATWRAGRAADLALRIRRHGKLQITEIEPFGAIVGLAPADLQMWALPTMRHLGVIDFVTGSDGRVIEVEERVGVAAPVLEQAASIWERLLPSAMEACAVASADHAAFCPMTESDHRGALEAQGHPAEVHEEAFRNLRRIGLLRRERSTKLAENVIWAPYVWGTEAITAVEFMKRLPTNEREALSVLSRRAAEHPGVSFDQLGDRKLVDAARHAGLLNATRVISGTTERGFAFSPSLDHAVAPHLTEATHERKLFTAHILNGHRFGSYATGKIERPLALVRAMINRGSVGPTTAAQRDYSLLEAAGIVRAQPVGGGQAMLHLVKTEVAEDSLEILTRAVEEDPGQGADSVDALWIPGSAVLPEDDRHRTEAPAGAEGELIQSAVETLREEFQRKQRGEELG